MGEIETFQSKPSNSEPESRFIFIVSQARSGTTAFQEFLSRTIPSLIIAGELFLPRIERSAISKILGEKYSELKVFDWNDERAKSKNEIDVIAKFKKHQENIDFESSNILKMLRDNPSTSSNVFVIKIFPNHLSNHKFNELLNIYRPNLIIIRRRLLFSYVSLLKAIKSGHFTKKDSSDVKIQMNEEQLRRYISTADSWFNNIDEIALKLEIPFLNITYEGFFESGKDVGRVLEFINQMGQSDFVSEVDDINLKVQDRRKDSDLAHVFDQFHDLPKDLQKNVIRYPGNSFEDNQLINFIE
jgi:hypothetical protein